MRRLLLTFAGVDRGILSNTRASYRAFVILGNLAQHTFLRVAKGELLLKRLAPAKSRVRRQNHEVREILGVGPLCRVSGGVHRLARALAGGTVAAPERTRWPP